MGEIGEPDRVVRRERDPVIAPALPTPVPELEPAQSHGVTVSKSFNE